MPKKISYKSAGVDISKADAFIKAIKGHVKATQNKAVMNRREAFGSLFAINKKQVLVSSTDGVGTKLLIAQMVGKHDTVGIDLVAMNVNDVLCCGAKPLFFLDYIACGKVKVNVLKDVVKGITDGCRQAGCALIGGETAEMPGMYSSDEYDLAGFAVGVVDKNKIIDGSQIKSGDIVFGLPSSGIHSNGYSLVRRVFSTAQQRQMAKELLAPTRIYVKEVLPLISKFKVKGIAHITGGAWYEKLTKILPKGKCFKIYPESWLVPKIFQKIQKKGRIETSEMFRTFNMGIGLALVVARKDAHAVRAYFRAKKIKNYLIGEVTNDSKNKVIFKH